MVQQNSMNAYEPPQALASRFVMVGDVRTHYLEAGQGESVILLHSAEYGGRADFSWRYNLDALAEHFHVYAPDLLGFGQTDKLYSFTNQEIFRIQHIRRFMDILGIEDAHFIGNSFSGGLIQRVASTNPTSWNIRSIISVSGGGNSPNNRYREILNGYDGSREHMREILKVLFWDDSWWSDEMVDERWHASIEPGAWEAISAARLARPGLKRPFRSQQADVSNIKCPILVVGGDRDLLREPGCWEDLHRKIPHSELHIFTPSRHCPHIEHAAQFNRLAIDFLQRHSTGSFAAR